jgi:hypothetical protein
MLNSTITIKIKQRINKLDSNDYDNIECWQIVESFNKAQVEWTRRQLHGINQVREGDEQSTRRKDDLQILLQTFNLGLANKEIYYEALLPQEYLQWKRVDVFAQKECCDKRRMTVYFAQEGDLNVLLRDKGKQPNFDWAETFATLIGNTTHIYTNNEFEIESANLIYYRQPRKIQIDGCVDPYTNLQSTGNVLCEFKDDIIELIIDGTVSIIAGDIESGNQFSRGTETAERNN